MRDPAFDALLPALQQTSLGPVLWIADENALGILRSVPPAPNMTLISNRFDVAKVAAELGFTALFNDFDFSALADNSMQRVIYRVSKEKPSVHHIINQALRMLAPGGELIIAGLKNEGTKTYIDKAKNIFGQGSSQKNGLAYRGNFYKSANAPCAELLDDQDYPRLRFFNSELLDFYSKPGLFGWDKIDQGSAFLIDEFNEQLAERSIEQSTEQLSTPSSQLPPSFPTVPKSLLDLGCGYGYLTLMTRHLPCSRRVATDNNAAAIIAAEKNFTHYAMQVEVVADDCGSTLQEHFDLILCNPPFHQGFNIDGQLTDKFLRQAQRLLAPQGNALFVVNQFINLEREAEKYFRWIEYFASNKSFKLIHLAQPR